MARRPQGAALELHVESLHALDVIVKGQQTWTVASVERSRTHVVVEVYKSSGMETLTYRMVREYLVTVRAEHECDCNGEGIKRLSGGTVNGVFVGKSGTCYGCNGKGWQSRVDVIRNHTYWSKYARLGV